MSETDAAADHASLVPGVHRLIRAIDGKEGPFAGTLVAFDETVAVCVDTDGLRDWAGWAFSGAEHVCGVLDIRRRADGHDALLPWCTQRVETFLGRRDASDSPLTPGELGTLVASLLRGVRELGTDADVLGDWWLTGDGRPLFVHGEGGSARARTAALIERMSGQQTDRATGRILEESVTALRQPRHSADDDRRWEEQLFARAAPRALQLDVFAPERANDVSHRLVAVDVAARDAESRRRRRADRERGRTGLTANLPGRRDRRAGANGRQRADRSVQESAATGPADLLRSLTDGMRTRMDRLRERQPARWLPGARTQGRERPEIVRTSKTSRRRSVLVAASLGAVVLIVGLLWPSEGGEGPAEASSQKVQTAEDASGEDGAQGVAATAEPAPSPAPTPSPATPESRSVTDTALDAVPALLDAISECVQASAEQCGDAVAEGARTPSEGIVVSGSAGSSATLVDDYGDVAVIRLTPIDAESGAAEQMMVLERHDEIWLVRDVYDVAHQPD